MIHKLRLKNFYSFLEETSIDFVVDKNAPVTDAYFTDPFENRLTKFMAFIGPNASGKTNLLKGIAFINWFITASFFNSKPEDEIPFKPFMFCSKSDPSEFEIVFETKGKIFKYQLTATTKRVLSEYLSVKNKSTNRFKSLFKRDWNSAKNKYEYDMKPFDLPGDFVRLVRENASIISTAHHINHKQSVEIIDYFSSVQSNIYEGGKVSPDHTPAQAIEFYAKNPAMRERAEEILSKFDLGISKIKIEEITTQDKQTGYVVNSAHKSIDEKKEYLLPFQYESTGTRNLFTLLRNILWVLDKGGVAVLDEMDTDLHPLMVPEIISLFTSKTYNPHNAQLLFSVHTAQVLNELDKQQITLVEKDERNISESWALKDLNVRVDENFYAKYMSGAYGAVPNL